MWRAFCIVGLLFGFTIGATAQQSTVKAADARQFIGTWEFTMTNPAGGHETVRVWDNNGVLAATVQAGRFPPIPVSGILKDGDILVLTSTRFENGKPDRSIVAITPKDDGMTFAQMLEFSPDIKRGYATGRKPQ
jgi:hypothetical protein